MRKYIIALCVLLIGIQGFTILGNPGSKFCFQQAGGNQVLTPNDVTEDILVEITIPAGCMNLSGYIEVIHQWSATNNANAKTARIRFSQSGGTGGTAYFGANFASTATGKAHTLIQNREASNSQVGTLGSFASWGTSGNPIVTSAVNTANDSVVTITCQKGVAGDTCALESYIVRVFYE